MSFILALLFGDRGHVWLDGDRDVHRFRAIHRGGRYWFWFYGWREVKPSDRRRFIFRADRKMAWDPENGGFVEVGDE